MAELKTLEILDLYSGSGAWANQWRNSKTYRVNIDSVDIAKTGEHINYLMDVRNFKTDKTYDIVYCSPPCEKFSRLNYRTTGNQLKEATELVKIAWSFAQQAKICYVIENPYTGTLPELCRTNEYFKDMPKPLKVDYSEYGYPIRKRTAIWTNIPLTLKIREDKGYNNTNIEAIPEKERSEIPYKLVKHIKEVILKRFNSQLRQYRFV
jgi:hypothetical protein